MDWGRWSIGFGAPANCSSGQHKAKGVIKIQKTNTVTKLIQMHSDVMSMILFWKRMQLDHKNRAFLILLNVVQHEIQTLTI